MSAVVRTESMVCSSSSTAAGEGKVNKKEQKEKLVGQRDIYI